MFKSISKLIAAFAAIWVIENVTSFLFGMMFGIVGHGIFKLSSTEIIQLSVTVGSFVVPLLIGPIVEEIAKALALAKGFRNFPLALGGIEFLWYFAILMSQGMTIWIIILIRTPPIIMHWHCGEVQKENVNGYGLLNAIAIHIMFNLMVPKIWNVIL